MVRVKKQRVGILLGAVLAAAGLVAWPALAAEQPCVGDCDGDGFVRISEVQRCINLGSDLSPTEACAAADQNLNGTVDADEIDACVQSFLDATSCPRVFTPPPTPTPSDTATPTITPTATDTPVGPTMTPTVTPTLTLTATLTPTETPVPTDTPTPTNTVPPTDTPTPTPTSEVLGALFVLGEDSVAAVQGSLFPITLTLTGEQRLIIGEEDQNGIAEARIPAASVHFPPIPVPGIGTACVGIPVDMVGIIDCDGGSAGIDSLQEMDHNTTPGSAGNSGPSQGLPDDPDCTATTILPDGSESAACRERDPCGSPTDPHEGVCNSPTHIVKSGTFGPGDMAITMVQTITILNGGPDFGSDGLPCTDDDAPEDPASPITILLSTGTSTVRLFDANNQSGIKIAPEVNCGAFPCTAQVVGSPFDCDRIRQGDLTGGLLGGGFASLHSSLGDIVTTFAFSAAPICASDADCAGETTCRDGVCQPPPSCSISADCPQGQLCILGVCRSL